MFTPTGFLYVPLPCTHNFEQCQQMARLCTMKISSKYNLEHILVRAIQTQNPEIFAGKFYESFLKRYFPILPSGDKHLTAGRLMCASMTSLEIFAFLSLSFNFVLRPKWSINKLATRHEQWIKNWLFWRGAAQHFLVQQQRAAVYTTQEIICATIKN